MCCCCVWWGVGWVGVGVMGRVKELLPEPDEYSSHDDYGYEQELEMLAREMFGNVIMRVTDTQDERVGR